MKLFLLGLFVTLCVSFTAQSQRVCASTDYTKHLLATDTTFKASSALVSRQIDSIINNKKINNIARRDTGLNEIIYIPVVVHLLYKSSVENISDAQVRSQIIALNKDFSRTNDDRVNTPQAFAGVAANARIQFCLAQVDPNGRKTTGIDRQYTNRDFFTTDDAMKDNKSGGVSSWDASKYLNLWVCKLSGRSLGYATPPGASADKDGVVIAYDAFGTQEKLRPVFNKGRTATHEIGHWLGLTHIWGDNNCGDDHVDDTPQQQSYNFGCPSFPKLSTCSINGDGDMFMNFMDFSDDACMNMFTRGQVQRMRALFAKNNVRNSFLASYACDSTTIEAGPLPVDTTPVVKPVEISLASTKVYPNPVQSVLTVDCKVTSNLAPTTMRIFNSVGVQVYTTKLVTEKSLHQLGGLVTGFYFVEITDGKGKYTTRIMKL